MDDSDRSLALSVLRDTLRSPGAKSADRVRAAQLLLEHDARSTERGLDLAAHDADDVTLLRIARGDTPTERGPAGTRAAAVPSASREDPATHTEDSATVNPFMQRGPKTDPPEGHTPTPSAQMGPKTDPHSATRPRGRPRKEASISDPIAPDTPQIGSQFASEGEMGDPSPRIPEPWE